MEYASSTWSGRCSARNRRRTAASRSGPHNSAQRGKLAVLGVTLFDDFFYLFTQAVQELRFRERADLDAVTIDQTHAAAAGDADVGHRRLARTIDRTAHHRDLDGRAILGRDALDLLGELDDVDLHAPARRARGDLGAALAQPKRLEQIPTHRHFLDRVGGQRNADRVADALGEQDAEPDRALHRAGARGTGFGDPQVERIVDLVRHQAVGAHGVEHVVRFEGDDDVVEVELLENADVAQSGFDHAFRSATVTLDDVRCERTVVDADTDGHAPVFRRAHDFAHLVGIADVARIEAQLIPAGVDRRQRKAMIEMDVRHERQRRTFLDLLARGRRLGIGHRNAHDLAARFG